MRTLNQDEIQNVSGGQIDPAFVIGVTFAAIALSLIWSSRSPYYSPIYAYDEPVIYDVYEPVYDVYGNYVGDVIVDSYVGYETVYVY